MAAILQPLKNHKPILIDRAVILVGRGADCDVVLNSSKKISRKHCCLVQSDQSFLIHDLGSTNGVWVNGKRVDRESEMTDGDRVAIADVQFQFFREGLQQSAADAAAQIQESVVSVSPDQPGHGDPENVIESIGDGLLDDDLIDIDDVEIIADTLSRPPISQRPKAKGRSFRREIKSEPVINLDDSFPDEEFDDIVFFDDE